jgi:hypothetical protein
MSNWPLRIGKTSRAVRKAAPDFFEHACNHSGAIIWISLSAAALLLASIPWLEKPPSIAMADQTSPPDSGYVGSIVCANCHAGIYESFSRTDMGRSMSEITPATLAKIPTSDEVFDSRLNRHFEIHAQEGKLYQSEYATGADGKDIFRNTQNIQYIIGAGANGIGAIVEHDDYLFEAPLSFYAKTHSWALSPGYEFGDYGFHRPILAACINCHSGQPKTVPEGNGRFRKPPFTELAIGCENCHGPGAAHVFAAQTEPSPGGITNPGVLSTWLSNNICMSCHQSGDARVSKVGKTFRDFRPGMELDDTLSIFLVPFTRESVPKDDLLGHYLSMRLSQCYLKSKGRLGCITCHNPHQQPSQAEAPGYFREKCLTCHTEKSCALPLRLRQSKRPPDDCVGCHMPKRDVTVISHSILTNHRIVAEAEEPFPDAAFHMTTHDLPDLIHLSADPTEQNPPDLLTLLQAYGQIVVSHPEYRKRYWGVARQLETSHPNNILVLEALADAALAQRTVEGRTVAVKYLKTAVRQGSTSPADFEQLARLMVASHRESEAIAILQHGIELIPYDAELYRAAVSADFSLGRSKDGCELAATGNHQFPEDDGFRNQALQCGELQRQRHGER